MASSHGVLCEMMLCEGRRKSSANFASASQTSPHASAGLMEDPIFTLQFQCCGNDGNN